MSSTNDDDEIPNVVSEDSTEKGASGDEVRIGMQIIINQLYFS